MSFPDFFIVGAPKGGTTALHAALARHPQLFMAPVKEPKYFLCDGPPPTHGGPGDAHSYREWIWRRDEYERLFEKAAPGARKGESTAFYLADWAAHRRIRAAVPDARLIVILRDPVDRAYSNWAHLWADGLETVGDFITACGLERQRREEGWAPIWRYLDTGLYGRHLQRLFEVFPRHQVHIIRYLSLVEEPQDTVDGVCRFLGVEESVVADVPPMNVGGYVAPSPTSQLLRSAFRWGAEVGSHFPPQVWRKASLPLQWLIQRAPQHRPELRQADRAELIAYFYDDIAAVEQITGWDLETWRSYREGGTYSVRKSWAPSRRLVS